MASFIISLLRFIHPTAGPAYTSTTSTITSLLNYHDFSNQDQDQTRHPSRTTPTTSPTANTLLTAWKENHLSQINVTGLTSALFGGMIAVSPTWPVVDKVLSPSSQSTVLGIWYAALVFALTSIATSAHQTVALNRLESHPEGIHNIRELLGKEDRDGTWKARKLELFIWQMPLSLLNTRIIFYAVGLGILFWSSVGGDWSWDAIKIVTLFSVALVYSGALYFLTSFWIYHRIAQSARDVVRESVEVVVAVAGPGPGPGPGPGMPRPE